MSNSEKFMNQFLEGIGFLMDGYQKAENQVERFERAGTPAEATAELITPWITARGSVPNFPLAATDVTTAGAAIIQLRTWMTTPNAGLGGRTPYDVFSVMQ